MIINAGIFCAYYKTQLPISGSKFNFCHVAAKHLTREPFEDEWIISLCHKLSPKDLKCPNSSENNSDLLRIILKYRLSSGDLLLIIKMFESVKSKVPPEISLEKFILTYIESVLQDREYSRLDFPGCDNNKQLPKITLSTVSQLKQVQVTGNFYKDFPYWSFGTRWNFRHELLIGEMFVHPKLGTICFKDLESTAGCVIIKNYTDDLRDFLDKYVYVEKFCIVSEIFNPNTKYNLEYFVMDFKHIKVLDFKRKRDESSHHLKFKMSFVLINKSNVTYTKDKGYHFWIDIKDFKHYKEELKRCFLCLPERLIKDYPVLEPSSRYTLSFSQHLAPTRDYEYVRIDSSLPQFILKQNNPAVLKLNGDYFPTEKLLFLNVHTLPEILTTKGLVSFQAILKYRKFNPNNSSRTGHLNTPPAFGTIGEKTHILDFKVGKVKTLTLYLNNWERMMTPVGLIPGVLVNVRNVLVQKTYCKSTALTTIELSDYKPKEEYQTTRLLKEDDWGVEYHFGGISHLPDGILVHSVLIKYRIIKMFMKRSCSKCLLISRIAGENCVDCGGQMRTTCELLIEARDKGGCSKITSKVPEVTRCFLGMQQDIWDKWLEILELLGRYTFQRYDKFVDHALSQEQAGFVKKMNYIVKNREKKHKNRVHLLARKLDNSRNNDKTQTLWYGLKAKLVNN